VTQLGDVVLVPKVDSFSFLSSSPIDRFSWDAHQGVLFDLDGVITPTAIVHEHAWATLFADFDYTEQDYLDHIDGKPRLSGVVAFLASRNITLPDGSPDDAPDSETIAGYGNRKNAVFLELLGNGIDAYPGSIATLDLLDQIKIPYAIVSSSRNATAVLKAAGIRDRFDIVIDGLVTLERGLPGKPAPDGYLAGAVDLGVDPATTVVVEDAVSGVEAGAAGNFVTVIGVDRNDQPQPLIDSGATFVVNDLAELLPSE